MPCIRWNRNLWVQSMEKYKDVYTKRHRFKTMDIIYYRRKPWDYKNYRKDIKNRNTEEEARLYEDGRQDMRKVKKKWNMREDTRK